MCLSQCFLRAGTVTEVFYAFLHVVEQVEYSRKEIRELLLMIDVGNRPRWSQKGRIGLKRTVSAFGIVGMQCFVA